MSCDFGNSCPLFQRDEISITDLIAASMVSSTVIEDNSSDLDSNMQLNEKPLKKEIWWSNSILFVGLHIVGLSCYYHWPTSWRPWMLMYLNWQIAMLGITIGISLFMLLT
jgi:hypothetical protein